MNIATIAVISLIVIYGITFFLMSPIGKNIMVFIFDYKYRNPNG